MAYPPELSILLKLHFTNPNVTEADWFARVSVRLQADRTIAVRSYSRVADVFGSTANHKVVQQYDSVLYNGY